MPVGMRMLFFLFSHISTPSTLDVLYSKEEPHSLPWLSSSSRQSRRVVGTCSKKTAAEEAMA